MQWLCWKISGPYLDIIRPAVLLPLVFDSALDQLQCFLPCRPRAFELPCCVMSTVIQCGSKALGQGVAAGPSLRAELGLCTVFGIWGRMNTWGWGERKEIRAGIERDVENRESQLRHAGIYPSRLQLTHQKQGERRQCDNTQTHHHTTYKAKDREQTFSRLFFVTLPDSKITKFKRPWWL